MFEGRRHVAPTLGQWHGSGAQGQAAVRMRPPFPVARSTPPRPPLELPLTGAALTQPPSRIIACLFARFASDALSPRYSAWALAVPASNSICGFRLCASGLACLFFPDLHTLAVVRFKRALCAYIVFLFFVLFFWFRPFVLAPAFPAESLRCFQRRTSVSCPQEQKDSKLNTYYASSISNKSRAKHKRKRSRF